MRHGLLAAGFYLFKYNNAGTGKNAAERIDVVLLRVSDVCQDAGSKFVLKFNGDLTGPVNATERQPLNEMVYPVTQGDEAVFGNRWILSCVGSPDLICVKFLREVEHF